MNQGYLESLRQLLVDKGWRLRFPAPLEQEFREDYAARYDNHMNASMLLGMMAIVFSGAFDIIWMPAHYQPLWMARLIVAMPMLFLLLLARLPFFHVIQQPVIVVYSVIAAAGVMSFESLSVAPYSHYYASAIMLVVMFVFVLSRILFVWGLICAALMLIELLLFNLFYLQAPMGLLAAKLFLFLLSCVFCLVGAFLTERGLRRNYLQSRLLSLENRDLEESNLKLQYLSSVDGLTQVANRRSLDVSLTTEWQRAMRKGEPVAVLMIDVDHFRQYNDTYGHRSGDNCLREVARALKDFARRPGDMVARYGGEEFAVVQVAAGPMQALEIAENVCARIRELSIPHRLSSHGTISVSIGVASVVPVRDSRPEALVLRADQALYEAKRSGRNRVVLG